MLTVQFDKRRFIILSFAFILATVVGTLSHEFGHYIAAKSLGYEASIHYGYVDYGEGFYDSINKITSQYRKQIEKGESFPAKDRYDGFIRESLWMSIGGPLQTLFTGTIGLILLLVCRKSFNVRQKLIAWQWVLIFITLFWLRQTANMIVWMATFISTKHVPYSDEIGIALKLGLPFWSLTTITGVIGIIILYVVIFKFIPKAQRQTFVLSGIMGGVTGYVLWLYLLGPVLLP